MTLLTNVLHQIADHTTGDISIIALALFAIIGGVYAIVSVVKRILGR